MIYLLYKAGVKLGPLYLVVHLLAWSNVLRSSSLPARMLLPFDASL